jgi:hypothetical protein
LNIGKGKRIEAEKDFELLFKETLEAVKSLCNRDLPDDSMRACSDLLDRLTEMSKAKNNYLNAEVIRKKDAFYDELYRSACDRFCLDDSVKNDRNQNIEMEVVRYLGVDFNSDGNKKVFTELMERKIHSTFMESMELAVNCVYIYRELTADLFMVKLLDLDLFGYLLASVRNLPMGKIPHTEYLRRVTLVLFLSCSRKKEKDHLTEYWKEIIRELWDKTGAAIFGMLNYFCEEIHSSILAGSASGSRNVGIWMQVMDEMIVLLSYLKDPAPHSADKIDVDELSLKMENLRDMLEVAYMSEKSEYLRDMLTETTTYCNLLTYIKYLSLHGMRFIKELNLRFKFLEEDLEEGCNAMIKMRNILQKGNLAPHLNAVSAFYNQPYGGSDVSVNSLEMLHFIQKMFYSKKVRTAEEIITYEKK